MILCIHRQEPNWPAEPKRPRFVVEHDGVKLWVETDGKEFTMEEVAAVLHPAPSE